MRRGFFITFEGNEGCGKSTQIRLLAAYLKKKKIPVFLTREPGGTKIGDAIRGVLLDPRHEGMEALSETLLYMAARAELVRTVIEPKLKKGVTVLCDRWLDATLAYQGFAGGVDPRLIKTLGEKVTRGLKPDLTFFLDLPLTMGLRRSARFKKPDRMEQKGLSYHRKVRAGYLKIIKKNPGRFRKIQVNAKDSISKVHEKIIRVLSELIDGL